MALWSHEYISLTSLIKGWLAKMEMFTQCKVVLHHFLPPVTALPELFCFNPLTPGPSPFKVLFIISFTQPTPLMHSNAEHLPSSDRAGKQQKRLITRDTLSPQLLLPEQTATVVRDSSGPLPSSRAPKQWNGTETFSSLHQDLLSRRDTFFTAGP